MTLPRVAVIVRDKTGGEAHEAALASALSALAAEGVDARAMILTEAAFDGGFARLRAAAFVGDAPAPDAAPEIGAGCYGLAYSPVSTDEISCLAFRKDAFQFDKSCAAPSEARLALVQVREGGLAAHLNIGLKLAEKAWGADFAIMLEPGVALSKGAAAAFADHFARDPKAGLVGGSLLDADAPHRAVALGGAHLSHWTMAATGLGRGARYSMAPDTTRIAHRMSMPAPAFFAMPLRYRAAAGPLDERFEGPIALADWATCGARAAGHKAARLKWARQAVAYGPQSASVDTQPFGALADMAERVLFSEKWAPDRAWFLKAILTVRGARAAFARFSANLFQRFRREAELSRRAEALAAQPTPGQAVAS